MTFDGGTTLRGEATLYRATARRPSIVMARPDRAININGRFPDREIPFASHIGNPYHAAMNVIARKNLETFWRRHPETEQPLRAWLAAVKTRNWTSMNAVLDTFSKASRITAERCVFDICGGDYRLIVAFKFSAKVAFIKFIGTHARYDRVSAATVSEY